MISIDKLKMLEQDLVEQGGKLMKKDKIKTEDLKLLSTGKTKNVLKYR